MWYFDDFRFDPTHRLLWRDGVRVPLTRKAAAVLAALVEHAGQPLSKRALLETVWPDAHVAPNNVKVLVCEIRSALCDSSDEPRYVKTSSDGYMFIAQVDRVRARSSRDEPFCGRQPERSAVAKRLAAAAQGNRNLLVIEGPAGIGKTALCDSAIWAAADDDFIVLQGQCAAFEHETEPFYPLLDALHRLASDVITVRDLVAAHAPLLLAKLLPCGGTSPADAHHERDQMPRLREIVNVIEALAEYAPTLLVLEDVQWADPSTMDVVGALARRRNNVRLMTIVTHRPLAEYPRAMRARQLLHELTMTRLCAVLRPPALDSTEVLEYLEIRFGAEVARALLKRFVRRTRGYPLLMKTAADDLVEAGFLMQDGQQWIVPTSLSSVDIAISKSVSPVAHATRVW